MVQRGRRTSSEQRPSIAAAALTGLKWLRELLIARTETAAGTARRESAAVAASVAAAAAATLTVGADAEWTGLLARRSATLAGDGAGNLGAASSTPILARFHNPVEAAKSERRWLEGLYLDVPEEWDDPYRFFRW